MITRGFRVKILKIAYQEEQTRHRRVVVDVDLAKHTWQMAVSSTDEEQSRGGEDGTVQTTECGEHHEHRHRPAEDAENTVAKCDGNGVRFDNL